MQTRCLSGVTRRAAAWRLAPAALLAALGFSSCADQSGGGPPPGMAVRVVAEQARQEPVVEKIFLVGTMAANELVDIKSEVDGRVVRIGFEEGKAVRGGDVLFALDEEKLAAVLAQAEANFRWSEINLERTSRLLRERTVSQQEYDQASAGFEASLAALALARQQKEEATIRAPFDGVVGERNISVGQYVSKGLLLATLVDTDPLKAEFHVPERHLGRLHVGQSIEIRTAAYAGETFAGEVYFISPRLDEATRTVLVKARIPNERGLLRPGMFGNLDLILAVREHAVLIPETALMFQGDAVSVYVVRSDGTVEVRAVELGARLPGRVEITRGVAAGESVVIEGTQKLGPGSPVVLAGEQASLPQAESVAAATR